LCKAISADGYATVKLYDFPNNAMGQASENVRFKRVLAVGKKGEVEVVV
jgi:nicotinate phosphoribosyltransferase